jgi:hypothetical protein
MAEYLHYIEGKAFPELEIVIEYNVSPGSRGSRSEPPEPPQVEIEAFRISNELAELLDCDPVLSPEKVKKYINLKTLPEKLIEDYENTHDDPEPNEDDWY